MGRSKPGVAGFILAAGLFAGIVACNKSNSSSGAASAPGPAPVAASSATFILEVAVTAGTGTVTSSPSGINANVSAASFSSGTVVTLTEAPASGNKFSSWGGACSGSAAACAVTLRTSRTVTASFAAAGPFALTVSLAGSGGGTVTSSPAGISCPGTCSASFPGNSNVTLTRAAAAGSSFDGWTGGGCSSGVGACVVAVNAAQNLTATFTSGGPVANLAEILENFDATCEALNAVDPAAIPLASCHASASECTTGSVVYGSFIDNASSGTANPALLSGFITETFNNCTLNTNGSVIGSSVTLDGTLTEVFNSVAAAFSPSNAAGWTAVALTGTASLSGSGLTVTPPGGVATPCTVGETITFDSTETAQQGVGGNNSVVGTLGCVAGQSGTVGYIRRH